jgi:coenzyme F420-dependent glucose-6-phosphate dehydrogenase
MVKLGYFLSSEEHKPNQLVRHAQLAEQSGFEFAVISDHFHPWVSEQGQSAFVWSVLGGIAQGTEQIRVGTAVTCPIMRIHPVLVAQGRRLLL